MNYFGIWVPKGTPDNVVKTMGEVWEKKIKTSEPLKKYAAARTIDSATKPSAMRFLTVASPACLRSTGRQLGSRQTPSRRPSPNGIHRPREGRHQPMPAPAIWRFRAADADLPF